MCVRVLCVPAVCLGIACVLIASAGRAAAEQTVRFSRDVLPLLSDRCFHCHGPDESHREAGLRLDEREAALDAGAIVPGDPDASELIARVTSDDADLVMPPADAHRKPLSDQEIETLRRWIADGAPWGKHWAFEVPARPEVPAGYEHPIDAFVAERLKQEGMSLAQPAASHTQLRRVAFDVTGLPPTEQQLRAFENDESPLAYQRFVDRLFQSPHYGERMAMWWLDAARYSDTDGYQQDATRTNWPWRDWVIDAFNGNMPFDQFTVEQFAGDLLPDATKEQQLATCFHRNHMTNGEGGRDPEESRIDYVIDRVNTVGSVWLGLTLGCAQCHSHKFDPISQRDYYSLSAFFNSIDEDGRAGRGAKPYLKYTSPHAQRAIGEAERLVEHRRQQLDAALARAKQEFQPWLAEQIGHVRDGFDPWQVQTARSLDSVEGTVLSQTADGVVQAEGPNPRQDDYRLVLQPKLSRVTALKLEVLPHPSHTDGKLSRGDSGEFILTDVKLQVRQRGDSQVRDLEIASAIADVEKDAKGRNYGKVVGTLDDDPRNGWTTESHDPRQPHTAVFALAEPLRINADSELIFVMLHRSTLGDANIGRFRVSATDQRGRAVRSLEPMPLEQLAAAKVSAAEQVDAKLRDRLLNQFLEDHDDYQAVKESLDQAERQLSRLKRAAKELDVMVLAEREQARPTHILERGVWDQKGDEVRRGVPAAVLDWPSDRVGTRLQFAEWLVSPENPLTARVIVNQLWQLCFGAGLVRTPEDFGLQGEFPTHPKLLDWLAVEFIESGWNVQHVLRLIVTSNVYRQSSETTSESLARDPDNRLLARGSRFRLPSWMIRDAALRASGLLNPAVGGPPVMPYQPDGVWAEIFMGRFQYEPSQGSAQHRRTVYAFWRRASAPTFLFDSAQRRVCEIRTRRTNTPLHALTLLNDVNVLEASRALARSVLQRHDDPEARIELLFRRILSRPPGEDERAVVDERLDEALTHYRSHPSDAEELLRFGQPEEQVSDRPAELASYTVVASMIFNLDEAITHE